MYSHRPNSTSFFHIHFPKSTSHLNDTMQTIPSQIAFKPSLKPSQSPTNHALVIVHHCFSLVTTLSHSAFIFGINLFFTHMYAMTKATTTKVTAAMIARTVNAVVKIGTIAISINTLTAFRIGSTKFHIFSIMFIMKFMNFSRIFSLRSAILSFFLLEKNPPIALNGCKIAPPTLEPIPFIPAPIALKPFPIPPATFPTKLPTFPIPFFMKPKVLVIPLNAPPTRNLLTLAIPTKLLLANLPILFPSFPTATTHLPILVPTNFTSFPSPRPPGIAAI